MSGAPVRVSTEVLDQWGALYEPADLESYPDGAEAIRAELGSAVPPVPVEHLTPDAVEVIGLARAEVFSRSQVAVGTAHLLLVLLRRLGPDRADSLGLPIAAVDAALEREPRSSHSSATSPLTPRSCRVLLSAGQRARSRPDPRATPDDILLALLDEPGGLAASLMDELDIEKDAVRANLAGLPPRER